MTTRRTFRWPSLLTESGRGIAFGGDYNPDQWLENPEIIDRDNILNATMGGMKQAVEELDIVPNLVLVDGNRTPAGLLVPAQPVVKGDATSASIGAASVLAKVSRDRYMLELDRQYPQYQLAKHKGYPTKLHYELIAQYGIQPFYRRSFLKKQGYWPENGK